MSATNHTDLAADGIGAIAAHVTTPDGQLDAAIGDRATLTTTNKTSLVVALNEIKAQAGTVLADNVVTQAKIADAAVGPAELHTAVAGNGLTGGGGTALAVNVDAATLEIATDILRVKDRGVTGIKVAQNALTGDNLVWDHHNAYTSPGINFDGKVRWFNPQALTLVNPDAANPTGNATLRLDAAVTVSGGKLIYLVDADLKVGDTPSFAIDCLAASGTFRLTTRPYNAAGGAVTGVTGGPALAFTGAVQTLTVTAAAIPATTVYLAVYAEATVGTAVLDIYAWRGTLATFLSTLTTAPGDDVARRVRTIVDGLVVDALNAYRAPGTNWGGRTRWVSSATLSIVAPDAANPFSGRTLRFAYQASPTFAGKWLYLDEMPARTNDRLLFTAHVLAGGGSARLAMRFKAADGVTDVGAQISGPALTMTGAPMVVTVTAPVPAGAFSVQVYVVRSSGTSAIDIHGWGGRLTSQNQAIAPASNPTDFWSEMVDARAEYANLDARLDALAAPGSAFPATEDTYGRHLLRDTRAQIAKIEQLVAGEQLVIAFFGDSWVNNSYIHSPLVTRLQARHGNAGAGWISFKTDHTRPLVPAGTSLVQSGVWTPSDQLPASRGVDIAHVTSTDVATPGKNVLTTTATDIRVQYMQVAGGGSFRWNVDGGAWATIGTANATETLATFDVTGLSNASHVLTIEVTVAVTAGVTLIGADCKVLGVNGVRVHKVGNGGLTAQNAADVDATIWQAGLAALAPNLAIILLGTNDHSHDVPPATFAAQITTLITRIRAARPATDILLLSPAANALATANPLSDYVGQLRGLAVSQNAAMVDGYLIMPDYTAGNARGLYSNTSHLSANGGQVLADPLLRALSMQA